MTITAVRLRARNPKAGYMLRTYVSFACGIKYKAGDGVSPPTWKITSNQDEIEELGAIKQFEIEEFADRGDLEKVVQSEMEENARLGGAPVRAMIEEADRPKPMTRDLSALEQPEGGDNKEGGESPKPKKKAKSKRKSKK